MVPPDSTEPATQRPTSELGGAVVATASAVAEARGRLDGHVLHIVLLWIAVAVLAAKVFFF